MMMIMHINYYIIIADKFEAVQSVKLDFNI